MKYNKTLPFIALTMAICILSGHAVSHPKMTPADTETLYQVALLQSLTQGDYTGSVSVGDLKRFGNTGLGTFDQLNGEMIVVDGVVYQALSDGTITVPDDTVTVPFATVTFFEEERTLPLENMQLDNVKKMLNQVVQKQGKNSFYMVKLVGNFATMKVRSEYAQKQPYLPLDQVMKTDQVIFDYTNVNGTVIALYCPNYMDKLNTPGWHFHFLSDDHTKGGHILDFSMTKGTASYDQTTRFSMVIPTHSAFQNMDLSIDLSEAIKKVETNK